MPTIVSIELGGTGANSAATARAALGVSSSVDANAAYEQANTARNTANDAYSQANTARSDANTTFATINTTFGTVNTGISTANTQANDARNQANSAYAQANLAYAAANNGNLLLGGVITGTLNVTQDIIVGGNVYLEGNTTFINVATYAVEDSLIYLASNNQLTDSVDIGFMGGKNTGGTYSHTGLARDATDAKWKLFDGLPEEGHVGNVVDFTNTYLATLVANVEANTLSVVNGVSGNVNFDSGTLFVDSVSNRIGIGTTNPSTILDVNGVIRLRDGSLTGGGGVEISSEAGFGMAMQSLAYKWMNATNTSEYMRITSGGNVGIGTTNPSSKLHILDSTGPVFRMVRTSNRFDVEVDNNAMGFVSRDSATANAYFSGFAGVGIGITSPGQKLHVLGTIRSNTSSTTGFGAIEILNDLNTMVLQSGMFGSARSGTTFGLDNANLAFMYTTTYSSAHPSALAIGTSSSQPLVFGTNGSERMRITGTGNVGIGTTNPGELLTVNGSVGLQRSGTQYWHLYVDTNNALNFTRSGVSDRVTISSDGNVGIGTTIPGYTLDLAGGTTVNQRLQLRRGSDDTSQHMRIGWDRIESVRSSVALSSPQTTLSFNQVGSDGTRTNMFIDTSGNVGIGTTNPSTKLHLWNVDVDTELRITAHNTGGTEYDPIIRLTGQSNNTGEGFLLWYDNSVGDTYFDNVWNGGTAANPAIRFRTQTAGSPINALTITHNGNVGIGTVSPVYKLVVSNAGGVGAEFDPAGTQIAGGFGIQAYNRSTAQYVPIQIYGSKVILDGGNVGVGTINPSNKLDVVGGITSREYIPAGSGLTYNWNGVIVQYYWTKIANLTGPDAYATLLIQGKLDVNYASYVAGLLTLSRFNDTSMSVQLDSISALDRVIEVRLDNNNDVWLKIEVEWNSSKTWSIINKIGSPTIYWTGLTEQLTTPANSILIRPGEQVRATQGAATSATVTNSGYSYAGNMIVRGSVGIGTAPTSRLTISAAGADGIQLTADTNSGGASNRLYFTHNGGAGTGVTLVGANSRTEGVLRFLTGATPGSNSGAQRMEFSMTGIGLGGTASPPDGMGIAFPASQSASSDANTLDDYEEGTYTPAVITSTGTPTYQYQEGYYTKIGRQVFGGGIIGITNSSSLTGPIKISLPFTSGASTYGYAGGATSDGSGFTFPVGNGFYHFALQLAGGNSFMEFIGVGTSAAPVNYNSSGVSASWYVRFSFSFRV